MVSRPRAPSAQTSAARPTEAAPRRQMEPSSLSWSYDRLETPKEPESPYPTGRPSRLLPGCTLDPHSGNIATFHRKRCPEHGSAFRHVSIEPACDRFDTASRSDLQEPANFRLCRFHTKCRAWPLRLKGTRLPAVPGPGQVATRSFRSGENSLSVLAGYRAELPRRRRQAPGAMWSRPWDRERKQSPGDRQSSEGLLCRYTHL